MARHSAASSRHDGSTVLQWMQRLRRRAEHVPDAFCRWLFRLRRWTDLSTPDSTRWRLCLLRRRNPLASDSLNSFQRWLCELWSRRGTRVLLQSNDTQSLQSGSGTSGRRNSWSERELTGRQSVDPRRVHSEDQLGSATALAKSGPSRFAIHRRMGKSPPRSGSEQTHCRFRR